MNDSLQPVAQQRVSARLRLTLSYAVFLTAAGLVALFGVYVLLRYIPTFPLTAENPEDAAIAVSFFGDKSREEILVAIATVAGIVLAVLFVIGLIGGWILTGRVLRPLRYINEAAQIAASGRLDRLEDAFSTQERFAANASHELRTPLTIMGTMLDVARRDPEAHDHAMLVDRLSITNARAIGLTEDCFGWRMSTVSRQFQNRWISQSSRKMPSPNSERRPIRRVSRL